MQSLGITALCQLPNDNRPAALVAYGSNGATAFPGGLLKAALQIA